MNFVKKSPIGKDAVIKKLQTYLYDNLTDRWNVKQFDAYGRVYKNKRSGKIVPEYYDTSKEYIEILLDDRIDGIMFFSPSDFSRIEEGFSIQECDLIFSVDLTSLKGDYERQDEEIMQDVLFLLNEYPRYQEVKRAVTGLNNVYKEFNGVPDYFKDMQSFFHFKITLELRFQNNKCK